MSQNALSPLFEQMHQILLTLLLTAHKGVSLGRLNAFQCVEYFRIIFTIQSGGRGLGGGRRSSFGARNGPSRGGGYHDRGNRSDDMLYEVDPQMKEYYAHMAVQQM